MIGQLGVRDVSLHIFLAALMLVNNKVVILFLKCVGDVLSMSWRDVSG